MKAHAADGKVADTVGDKAAGKTYSIGKIGGKLQVV